MPEMRPRSGRYAASEASAAPGGSSAQSLLNSVEIHNELRRPSARWNRRHRAP